MQSEISKKLTLNSTKVPDVGKAVINIPTGAVISIKKIGATDGYDGHCLRSYYYFKDQMPDIDPNSIESINSIKDKYSKLRSISKSPSFALTYYGTVNTLIKRNGFEPTVAQTIYNNYHELYKVSDDWIKIKLDQAKKDGYVTAAFGLKVRTNLLYKAYGRLSYLQEAEGRTAGNALGQSWGLLNNRAMREVLSKVDAAGFTNDIYPVAAIHDACYYMIRNNASLIVWFNEVVTQAAKWNDDPVIYHEEVGLEGNLDIFYPTWADPMTLPENLDEIKLIELCTSHMFALEEKKKNEQYY